MLRKTTSLLLLLFLGLRHATPTSESQFTFSGFSGADLALDGDASVAPGGLLALTNGTTAMTGHALWPLALPFREPRGGAVRSFSTTFVFAIVSPHLHLSSHGMAFLVSPSKNLSTSMPFQYLGLLNSSNGGKSSNHIFAVELDTVLNYEFHDIDINHVGIDIDSLISVQAASAGYFDDETGVFRNLSLFSRQAMQVWVDYDGQTMELTVTLAPLEVPKPKKPLLSATVNLSTVVTDMAYVGFSSSTGIMACSHYVLGWSFSFDGAAPAIDYSKLPKLPRFGPKPKSRVLAIVLPVAIMVFTVVAGAAILVSVRRQLEYTELREDWEVEFGPHRFSYKDLFRATDGFKEKQLLGKGGFGSVYKGVLLTSNVEVAVKRVSHESRQGMKEFITEVASLGRLRHRNLVQLLGYCRRKGELLLVYDYMSNGSLDKYLYDESKPTLDWAGRFRVVKGVASGLLYLHEEWEQVVVHRDIKASNVLLDGEMNGRLGDFGLARLYDHGTAPHTTHIVGTTGYLAPELMRTGKATPVTDVFAFGAFLLEVACGRRPVEADTPSDGSHALVDWVLEHWCKGSITDTVDARLGGEYDVGEARMVLKLGLLCSHPLPGARPAMRQAMQYLDGDMPLPELSPEYLSFDMLDGLSSYILACPSPVNSMGAMTDVSGGR